VFVCKEGGNNEIRLVGTDSFRLGEKVLGNSIIGKDFGFSVIIPSRTVSEVIRIFSNREGNLKVVLEKNQISFELDKIEVVSRLIEGNFPNYRKLIPQEFNTKVIVKKEDFVKNLRLVSLFSSRVNDISLSFAPNGKDKVIKIFASDADIGENTSELQANISGNELQIKFNYKFLIDGIALIESQEVLLSFIDDIKPCLIKSPQDKSFLYLVMPIRA
jgi:DNA polymerase-3 subunit beta